jgi:hypothetical protein
MGDRTNIRTIKIKVRIAQGSDEGNKAAWRRLRQIDGDAWRAANLMVNGHFFNDSMVPAMGRRSDLSSDSKEAGKLWWKCYGEMKKALEPIMKEYYGRITNSGDWVGRGSEAATEWDARDVYSDLPSSVANPLKQQVSKLYNSDKQEVFRGDRSVRTYKKGMSFPIARLEPIEVAGGKYVFIWKVSRGERIRLVPVNGWTKKNVAAVAAVGDVVLGKVGLCAPPAKIKLDGRDLYLLLSVRQPVKEVELDLDKVLGVDLGFSVAAYFAVFGGPQRFSIPGEVLDKGRQIQQHRRRLQKCLTNKGGRGRARKMRVLDKLRRREDDWRRTLNHFLSKMIVDKAMLWGCGTIQMEFLTGDGLKEFILRNWGFYGLRECVRYKAEDRGIVFRTVDTWHTSQECHQCGDMGKRDGRDFVCENPGCSGFGKKIHADYNGAANIAKSNKIVTDKGECEYFRRKADRTFA